MEGRLREAERGYESYSKTVAKLGIKRPECDVIL